MKIDLNDLAFNKPLIDIPNEEWNKKLLAWSIACAERVFKTWHVDKDPGLVQEITLYLDLFKEASTDKSKYHIVLDKWKIVKNKEKVAKEMENIAHFILGPLSYIAIYEFQRRHNDKYSPENLERVKAKCTADYNDLVSDINKGEHLKELNRKFALCFPAPKQQGHDLALLAPHYATERAMQMIDLINLIQDQPKVES